MEPEHGTQTAEPEHKGTGTPSAESQYHKYIGNDIPWFVHVIWVCFWLFAIWYIIAYQLPIVKEEFLSPP